MPPKTSFASAEIDVIGIRRGAVVLSAKELLVNTSDQTVRGRDRQRLEQHGIHDGKERGVEADADRQRSDRHQREPRTLAKPPDGIANVGKEGLEQD